MHLNVYSKECWDILERMHTIISMLYVTKCKYVIITKHELEGVTSLYVAMGQISAGTGSLVTLYEDDIYTFS